jgi:hypothetical protein
VPLFKEGTQPSFRQPVPIAKRAVKSPTILKIRTTAGERIFTHGDGFKWVTGNPPSAGRARGIVRAGYAISEPENGWDDLRRLDPDRGWGIF